MNWLLYLYWYNLLPFETSLALEAGASLVMVVLVLLGVTQWLSSHPQGAPNHDRKHQEHFWILRSHFSWNKVYLNYYILTTAGTQQKPLFPTLLTALVSAYTPTICLIVTMLLMFNFMYFPYHEFHLGAIVVIL